MELSPEWVVGFVDGEGCFFIGIQEHPEMTMGYQILPEFVVVQHERDIQILYALKRFFKCGVVRKNHGDRFAYRVRKLECLGRIVEFFESYSLKTKKNVDFRKFRKIVLMMKKREHLTREGMIEIVKVALEMNTKNRERLHEILKKLLVLDKDIVHT